MSEQSLDQWVVVDEHGRVMPGTNSNSKAETTASWIEACMVEWRAKGYRVMKVEMKEQADE